MRKRTSIAIDIGGTIEDTWDSKREWFKSRGYDIGVWPKGRKEVVQTLDGDDSLYEEMVKSVYGDDGILSHQLISGAKEALKSLSARFSIVFLSSRPEEKRKITYEWMMKRGLVDIVDQVVLLGNDFNKLEWCRQSGVSVFIDDDKRHLEPNNTLTGVFRILYCPYSGEQIGASSHIVTANDWPEIIKLIMGLKNISSKNFATPPDC